MIAANVVKEIENGDGGFGTPRAPEGGVSVGTETIDGVTFELETVNDAEAPEHLLIKIPEAGAIIVQDLVYSGVHAYPFGNVPNWINVLEGLLPLTQNGYKFMLNGHGMPSNFSEINQLIGYLNFQQEAIGNATTAEEAINPILEQYPGYSGAAMAQFIGFAFQQDS